MVEIDQSEWHIWVWCHYVAIFQRRYLKPWLESLLSWWPAAAQLLSHYISKQLWGGGTTIEQTLTEDFHRTEKLENCPGNKTFIYLFYIAGLLFEVLPTKMQTLSLSPSILHPRPHALQCLLLIHGKVKLKCAHHFEFQCFIFVWFPVETLVSVWDIVSLLSPEIRDRGGPSWSWSELTWRIFFNWQHVCFNKAFWAIIWWCFLFTNNSLDNICQSNLIIISNPPFSGNRLEVSMKVWLH